MSMRKLLQLILCYLRFEHHDRVSTYTQYLHLSAAVLAP